MKRNSLGKVILVTLSSLFLSFFLACGPSVKLSPELLEKRLKKIAILPIVAPPELRSERVAFIESYLYRSLRSKSYEILDREVMASVCTDGFGECSQELLELFKLDGFVIVQVESDTMRDFGLGFYNAISGNLQLLSPESQVLARIEHTESKKGGLVFQSGQVIDAISEQIENYGDEGFNALAEKFVDEIVAEVPSGARSSGRVTEASEQVLIRNARARELGEGVYEVCVNGTPNRIASVLISQRRSNLREVSKGRYCGNFFVSEGSKRKEAAFSKIELKTPFGRPVIKEVDLFDSKMRTARKGVNRV